MAVARSKTTKAQITGTLYAVSCRAVISPNSFTRKADGQLDFDYSGESDVFWDEEHPVERDGQLVFLDADGREYLADDIELVESDDTEED